jgi:hypothetical protein
MLARGGLTNLYSFAHLYFGFDSSRYLVRAQCEGPGFHAHCSGVSSPLDSPVIPNFDSVVQAAQIFDVDGQLSASPQEACLQTKHLG